MNQQECTYLWTYYGETRTIHNQAYTHDKMNSPGADPR